MHQREGRGLSKDRPLPFCFVPSLCGRFRCRVGKRSLLLKKTSPSKDGLLHRGGGLLIKGRATAGWQAPFFKNYPCALEKPEAQKVCQVRAADQVYARWEKSMEVKVRIAQEKDVDVYKRQPNTCKSNGANRRKFSDGRWRA